MTSTAFSNAVNRALASSSSYVYGSLMKPDIRAVPVEEKRGFLPPPLLQWVLQGDQFETALLEQYNNIAVGEARMLVASTGIGKTTVLPLKLVSASGKAGIVLMPNSLLVASAVKYVSDIVVPNGGYKVTVDALRSQYVKSPINGPAVYYCAAEDFLPRYHSDRSLIERMNIDFIYLDEAHENTPAYYIIRMFVGLKFFNTTKVFYGTATSTGTSMALTGTKNKTKPIPIPSSDFILSTPEDIPISSPLHFSSISGRTLIFLPTDHHLDIWDKYYDGYDIPVLTYASYDGSRALDTIKEKLKSKVPMVFLATSRVQTGHTFDIDVVICCGYTQELDVDYSIPEVKLIVRPVTAAERTQRVNRAGRHLQGTSYYNDIKVSPPLPELTMSSTIYVYMWARMFNIQIKNVDIAQFSELLSGFSLEFIALMLCSRIHPVLIMSYLTEEGQLYRGWPVMKHVFHTDKPIKWSDEDNDDYVSNWPVRNTGPQLWLEEPMEYKSRAKFPDEWQALPAFAWKLYVSGESSSNLLDDNISVVSALAPNKRNKKKVVDRSTSVRVVGGLNYSRPMSTMTTFKKMSPVNEDFSGFRFDNNVLETGSAMAKVTSFAHVKKPSVSTITEEIPRGDSINEWIAETSSVKRSRRRSHKSSSSGSSHEKMLIELKKVNAMDHKYYKLYPMDTLLLSEFMSEETARQSHFDKFYQLIKVKRNFSSLHSDAQTRVEYQNSYFLAVLRVHNHQVMEKLQIKASGSDRASFIEKFMGKSLSNVDVVIDQSTRLLQSMQFENFFVGIDKRTQHMADLNYSPMFSDKLERAKVTAEYLLHTADIKLREAVEVLKLSGFAIKQDNEVLGIAWKTGHAVLLPYHIYEYDLLKSSHMLAFYNEVLDVAVCRADIFVDVRTKFRGPAEYEQVLFVGIDPRSSEFCVIGPANVITVGDIWCTDMALKPGFSGFLLLSVIDCTVIGMYKGYYMSLDTGTDYGHFIPSSDFLSEIAKIY